MIQFSEGALKGFLQQYFTTIEESIIDELLEIGNVIDVKTRESVIHQGDHDTDVFFLLAGKLKVSRIDIHGKTKVLNEINSGEFFGEMALLTGKERSTNIFAVRNSSLLQFDGDSFNAILNKHAGLMKYIAVTLIERLADSNQGNHKRKINKTIAFLPIDPSYPLNDYLQNLCASLEIFGKVLHLSSSLIQQEKFWNKELSLSDLKRKFSSWLFTRQKDFDFILFAADYHNTPWSKICYDEADIIMKIGKLEHSHAISPIENDIIRPTESHEIVDIHLIIDNNNKIDSPLSDKITANRIVKNIFWHQDADDYGRIARFLAGHSIKFVLGGGGAKGFAHLGVYKAMIELGIPVDFIGGTSIGSVMGAAMAIGWTYDEIIKAVYQSFVISKPLKDYHLPLVSLVNGSKLERIIGENFTDIKIEDLPIPFYAVAANLSKSTTEILDKGKVVNALRASISLPSILPPYVHGNSLLLDGGIVDNLPYDHIQTLAEGPTIGVDVSVVQNNKIAYDRIPSNLKLFMDKLTKRKRYQVPGIHHIMMETMTLASNEKRLNNMHKFDVYIQPDVERFSFLKWNEFHNLVEEGYKSSIDALRKWKDENSFLI